MSYKPLNIELLDACGISSVRKAMRLPFNNRGKTDDRALMRKLIRGGDSHAKCTRGLIYWVQMSFQAGWMIELDTYRHGREVLSTSSSMHNELKELSGPELAEQKQADLTDKYYTQICTFSAQALRRIYIERRKHRHPDWQLFCDFVEELPWFDVAIMPEVDKNGSM